MQVSATVELGVVVMVVTDKREGVKEGKCERSRKGEEETKKTFDKQTGR